MTTGLYIHIPFCASRCVYCGFYSTTRPGLHHRYVQALCREMQLLPERPPIGTIYLGGGTPSQLSHALLEQLFTYIYKLYTVSEDAEVTVECNPDDVRPGMFDGLPVNRVSMGAQTFSDERLRFLRRRHTAREVGEAIRILRHDGIDNISIDLMFGFPKQTLDEWADDLRQAMALAPEHLSAYSLMYEEGTPLYSWLEKGKVEEIDEETSRAMYEMMADRLTAAGYEHYEISNFAQPGRRSRHNASYWHNVPYIGLGASAHSYDLRTRQWNVDDIGRYMKAFEDGTLPRETEVIDARTHFNDLVTTALRTREGICLDDVPETFRATLLADAAPHLASGLLLHEDNRLHLSRAGILVSNTVMSDLMRV